MLFGRGRKLFGLRPLAILEQAERSVSEKRQKTRITLKLR